MMFETVTESVLGKYDENTKYALKYRNCFKRMFWKEPMWDLVGEFITAETQDLKEQQFIFNWLLKYPQNECEEDLRTIDALKASIKEEWLNYLEDSKSKSRDSVTGPVMNSSSHSTEMPSFLKEEEEVKQAPVKKVVDLINQPTFIAAKPKKSKSEVDV